MKKLTILITTLLFIQFTAISQSPCLPEGITFSTQAQIDSFQVNYPECYAIGGDVYICGNDIDSLNGLNVLTSIGGSLEIAETSLVDLSGLENLSYVEENFSIGSELEDGFYGNPNLQSLSGLYNLNIIGGQLSILNNDLLIDLSGLNNLVITSGLYITGNDVLVSLTGLENLSVINGNVNIGWINDFQGIYNGNPSLASFTALFNLNHIAGNFMIYGNLLTNLTGLENLYTIEGDFTISTDSITDLTGLGNLTFIGGYFSIGFPFGGNASLTSLNGMDNLTSISGSLNISSAPSLLTLSGLENLVYVGADLVLQNNNSLFDLSGLENLESGSIEDLTINGNDSLAECDIQVICDYLSAPNGTVYINDNAPGCENQWEVENACLTAINEPVHCLTLQITPNPVEVRSLITYSLENNSSVAIEIHNLSGRKVVSLVNEYQQQGEQRVILNSEKLKPGIYFCTIKTSKGIQTRKIIKL